MVAQGHARRFEHAPGKSALPPIATRMMSRETDRGKLTPEVSLRCSEPASQAIAANSAAIPLGSGGQRAPLCADNLFRGGREQIGGLFFKRRAFDRCSFRSLSEQISSLFVVRFQFSPHDPRTSTMAQGRGEA